MSIKQIMMNKGIVIQIPLVYLSGNLTKVEVIDTLMQNARWGETAGDNSGTGTKWDISASDVTPKFENHQKCIGLTFSIVFDSQGGHHIDLAIWPRIKLFIDGEITFIVLCEWGAEVSLDLTATQKTNPPTAWSLSIDFAGGNGHFYFDSIKALLLSDGTEIIEA